jgi:hypothetical protein
MSGETCVEFEIERDLGSLKKYNYFGEISYSIQTMSGGVIKPIEKTSIDYFDNFGEVLTGERILQMTPGCMGVKKPRIYKLAKKEIPDFNTMLASSIEIIKDIQIKGPISKGRLINSFISMCKHDDGSGEKVHYFHAIKDPADRKWYMYCRELESNWKFSEKNYILVIVTKD